MSKNKTNIFQKVALKFEFLKEEKNQKIIGVFLMFLSLYILTSLISHFLNGKVDYDHLTGSNSGVENYGGALGNKLAYFLIHDGFGVSSFLIPIITLILGINLFLQKEVIKLKKNVLFISLLIVWISLFFGFLFGKSLLAGGFGYEINLQLLDLIGPVGTGFLISVSLIAYLIFKFNPVFNRKKKDEEITTEEATQEGDLKTDQEEIVLVKEVEKEEITLEKTILEEVKINESVEEEPAQEEKEEDSLNIDITTNEEETLSKTEIKEKTKDLIDYDPTLDLSSYKVPSIDLLNDYGSGKIEIDKSELEENKNRIVQTLNNYKIGISSISATIGPTITLYEIVPEAGIRISKIKNLEDDIALSLSALGIRIIAPIPGKGTIGIEVPNLNPATVSMKAVLASDKFQNSDMELPIALGKTISNETFVADLAKMPHLLMAGATGQGKSVGLNAILASLLYKKHPSQVKFVLVDPKKVELTLFNKIERHFLAKLPDTDEAIITDTKKVINTLNSLCIEMDQRYDLLQNAQCRNIVEYNKKFIARKLNPLEGHKYLPYIILVIDEFADLIMTAGKEVETPIARLAQLARAIGIHLIVATQRPSVNVITGIIKANFPARVAFRVTSKIDSRTILDAGGADQLIGRGDMLISLGSDLTRLQCAFIDTPEVEEITDFIGNQRAYPEAFLLPEYVGDAESSSNDADLDDRDALFEDAARMIVQHQSGSTSLIQRKLKLGYNRAGRIIDQLEAARIVGPFEGSKARQVLVKDEFSLEEILNNLNN
jgi:S-DNA-T family DNA segregation ATPase FtsK/SpoIIIE